MLRLLSAIGVVASFALAEAPALAGAPEAFSIETTGRFTSSTSVAGTFSTSGAITAAGSYTEEFRLVGETIQAVKTLHSTDGTLIITVTAVVESPNPTTVSFDAGHWHIVSGTGAFSGAHGGGSPGASGIADLAAGTVQFSHDGLIVLPEE
jgi:hypothetical protein